MNSVLKPIKAEEYESFYREIYSKAEDGVTFSQFRVPLDKDPSVNPKGINEKLATVQGLKDRMVVILNRAIKNESYWKTMAKRLEDKFQGEMKKAYLLPDVRKEKNQEGREGVACSLAKQAMMATFFKGEGSWEGRMAEIDHSHAEALAFLTEIKNLYENLDASSMTLAVQLKATMMNARVYGSAFLPEGGQNGKVDPIYQ